MPICLRLLTHWVRAAASRTFWTAGNSSPIRMAMMAITTSNSISVNARRVRRMGETSGWGEEEDERQRATGSHGGRPGDLELGHDQAHVLLERVEDHQEPD